MDEMTGDFLPKNIRAVIVDLDRTLLRTDKSLSLRNIRALQSCRARGLKIMVATARPHRCMLEYSEKIPFDACTVTNGAIIFCGAQRIEHVISPESASRLLSLLCDRRDLLLSVEMGNQVYSNRPIPDYESEIYGDLPRIPPGNAVYKILVNFDDPALLALMDANLPPDLFYTVANGHLLQIMSRNAGKWNGVQSMLAFAGLSPQEALYFGDDQDDIEPLKNCGIGVAMENAIPAARAAADFIAPGNDEDGVALWLETFFSL